MSDIIIIIIQHTRACKPHRLGSASRTLAARTYNIVTSTRNTVEDVHYRPSVVSPRVTPHGRENLVCRSENGTGRTSRNDRLHFQHRFRNAIHGWSPDMPREFYLFPVSSQFKVQTSKVRRGLQKKRKFFFRKDLLFSTLGETRSIP